MINTLRASFISHSSWCVSESTIDDVAIPAGEAVAS